MVGTPHRWQCGRVTPADSHPYSKGYKTRTLRNELGFGFDKIIDSTIYLNF